MFNWFRQRTKTKDVAKDRLRVVLMQDRLSLSHGIMEEMKDEVIMAISKYVEIDRPGIEFSWKEIDKRRALVANIPVISIKRGATSNDRVTQRSY
ncbi:MAG: cell division topological specificity factor MinE [Bacillota bacterium]|nr:cell division topological specificity factor MinE [Candidatus Fermentithermobacillaceae bacterium]